MDLRQTPQYAAYTQSLGWKVEKLSGNYIYLKKIPLLGFIAKLQRPLHKTLPQQINDFCLEKRIKIFYLELLNEPGIMPAPLRSARPGNRKSGLAKSKSCFLPSKTIQIDLKPPKKEIFNQFKKNTRYEVRSAEKQGVVVKKSDDIEMFANLWQKSARNRGMWLPLKKEIISLWKSFGPNAHLLFAYQKMSNVKCQMSNVLAGILLAHSPNSSHYMYAFSTKDGNRASAPSLLVWEAIKRAKKEGCKIFDFEGIYDERYPNTRSWKGFTKFKEGFGGKVITYPETLVKYYNPIARLLRL